MPVLFTPSEMPEDSVIAVQIVGSTAKIHLLHVLSREDRPMTMRELAEALGTNKVSVRLHLLELEDHGLVGANLTREERPSHTVLWTVRTDRVRSLLRGLENYALGVRNPGSGSEPPQALQQP